MESISVAVIFFLTSVLFLGFDLRVHTDQCFQKVYVETEDDMVLGPLVDSQEFSDLCHGRSSIIVSLIMKELKILRQLLAIFEAQEDKGAIEDEWKKVAIVLDRLFIIILIVTIVISTAIILSEQPNYDKTLSDFDF